MCFWYCKCALFVGLQVCFFACFVVTLPCRCQSFARVMTAVERVKRFSFTPHLPRWGAFVICVKGCSLHCFAYLCDGSQRDGKPRGESKRIFTMANKDNNGRTASERPGVPGAPGVNLQDIAALAAMSVPTAEQAAAADDDRDETFPEFLQEMGMASPVEGIERDGRPVTMPDPSAYVLDACREYPTARFWLEIHGVKAIPVGEIVALSGAAKGGKTQFADILAAAILTPENLSPIGFESIKRVHVEGVNRPRVMLVDTEQGGGYVSRNVQRIAYMSHNPVKRNNPNFTALVLADFMPEMRYLILKSEIARVKPDVIILDGIADIIDTINDERAAQLVLLELMTAARRDNMTVIALIHTRQGDTKLNGWIGSVTEKKAAEIWNIGSEKDSDGKPMYFEAKQRDSRDEHADGLQWVLDVNATPELRYIAIPTENGVDTTSAATRAAQITTARDADTRAALAAYIEPGVPMRVSSVYEAIAAHESKTIQAAKQQYKRLTENGRRVFETVERDARGRSSLVSLIPVTG